MFDGISVHDLRRNAARNALAEVAQYDENTVLNVPIDDLISSLVERFKFDVPEVDQNAGYGEPMPTAPGSSRVMIRYHLPFTGDRELLSASPSHRTLNLHPMGANHNSEIFFELEIGNRTADEIDKQVKDLVLQIRTHLARMRQDFHNSHQEFEDVARSRLTQRRAELLARRNIVANLPFPMRARADAPANYRAPEVRRKITPVSRPSTTQTFRPEPELEEKDYQHILGVMDSMTKMMERSPHTFVKLDEEAIRDHFLVQLNGHYEGQATGETFNSSGKTDILIRSGDRNIFIAECKFWQGEKVFNDTVAQLLGYLTWRDTKTAIVIFNRNKNLSGVVETIKKYMDGFEHRKHGPKIESETRLRYVLANPGDANREIITTILVYDIPQ